MKFTLHYCAGLFEIKTSGDATLEKFKEIHDALLKHKEWKPGTSILLDHTQLNSGPLTSDNVQVIADYCEQSSSLFGQGKCAVLVARDLEYGLARMWQLYVEGKWDVTDKLFKTRDAAIDWLSDIQESP